MIPKIVHQIWIGSNKRPDIWMDTVKDFCYNFGYEYKLWDNDNINSLTLKNIDIFNIVKEYCGKADVLRYEILYQFGGVYIDADSVILKPDKLNMLIEEFEADCGLGYEIDNEQICNGVILANKDSLFLKRCIDDMVTRKQYIPHNHPFLTIGPCYITEQYDKYKNEINIKIYKRDVFYPGRWHGTKTIDAHKYKTHPEESVMFQYGYSTNFLDKFFELPTKPRFIFNKFNKFNK